MNFSEAPPFRMMGTTVAIGVVVSFVLAVTFLPALLSMLPAAHTAAQRGGMASSTHSARSSCAGGRACYGE